MPTTRPFRDCKAWMDENLRMSTTSDEAVRLYDHALHQIMSHTPDQSTGGPMGAIEKMLLADANFVMGHVLDGGMKCMSASSRLSTKTKEVAELLNQMKATNTNMTDRERLHCSAIVEWANENNSKACQLWEEILFTYPRDTLAVSFVFLGHLMKGNSVMLRDSIARILNSWDHTDADYGYILNRYAFGLEETNMFEKAERTAIEGLGLISNDSWGIHTRAHIFESTCRSMEGIEFLRKTESDWSINNSLACHNYWHLSLYYIEHEQYEEALALYDDIIKPAYKKSGVSFNINDGTQLLQRLEFEGINVGERWKDLSAAYVPYLENHMSCYDDSHMLISFVKSKSNEEENNKEKFLTTIKEYITNAGGDNKMLTQHVGMDVCEAIMAYEEGRYDDGVELLFPIKHEVQRFGGSHAQRDLYDLFLLNACIQSKSRKHQEWGRGLLHEKKLMRPQSPLTDRMLEKLMSAHFH